jgi:hypothetical protein
MTVLIMIAYMFPFEARRRRYPWMMIFFGLSLEMASSVKPTVVPLGACLLGLAVWDVKRKDEHVAGYLWSSLLGASIAAGIVTVFLVRYDAAGTLMTISRRQPLLCGDGAYQLPPVPALPIAAHVLFPFAIVVASAERCWKNWDIGQSF